jgi:hypothetical protein
MRDLLMEHGKPPTTTAASGNGAIMSKTAGQTTQDDELVMAKRNMRKRHGRVSDTRPWRFVVAGQVAQRMPE